GFIPAATEREEQHGSHRHESFERHIHRSAPSLRESFSCHPIVGGFAAPYKCRLPMQNRLRCREVIEATRVPSRRFSASPQQHCFLSRIAPQSQLFSDFSTIPETVRGVVA
ncbi:MAG TPA: hypothetical protein VGP37_01185, partial [Candidatus Nanopelagicales bacterium]|nr:hypothetical protein [Candidatus Nanopelagicales bacterium]